MPISIDYRYLKWTLQRSLATQIYLILKFSFEFTL